LLLRRAPEDDDDVKSLSSEADTGGMDEPKGDDTSLVTVR